MFRAIRRYFRALGYLIVGKIDAARMELSTSPTVIQATYDNIILDKKKRIQQYKDAVAGMIAQEEKKKAELKRQTEQVERLEKLREGAAAMARRVVERLGNDAESVKQDAEYLKCQAAYKDFSSTLAEKESRIAELEADITTIGEAVAGHKVQLESLLRDLEKVSHEKHEAVADVITAREERELSDMISGISQDRTSEELQELRDLREKAKASARVSREMAGVETKRSEEEFLQYAERSAADNEFDALIGLTRETETKPEETADRTRLPEQ